MRDKIRAGLAAKLDGKLVDELLEAHAEAKEKYYLGGLRLSEVEGGRFCEAAFRLLEQITTGKFTPIGRQLDTNKLLPALESLPAANFPEAVRIHIPRALRLVYDIRNKRDAAHLADGIDPNLQDGTLVVSVVDWVLAEFIRLYHQVSANEAREMVEDLVTRAAPVVQDFAGDLKVLRPGLKASDHCLVLLYHRGSKGATFDELEKWVRPPMRKNLGRSLDRLEQERDLIHHDGTRYFITRLGQQEVERRHLVKPTA